MGIYRNGWFFFCFFFKPKGFVLESCKTCYSPKPQVTPKEAMQLID